MDGKIRTTIYIDRDLMEMAHVEIDNFSKTIEMLLSSYLSTSNLEEIDKRIDDHKLKIKMLEERRTTMKAQGVSENRWKELNRIL